MKAKIIKADSGTTRYVWGCMKFKGEEFGSRDYPGEWITCVDFISQDEVVFNRRITKRLPESTYYQDVEEAQLANFILKEFDSLKDVEEISPRDWGRVVEEKPEIDEKRRRTQKER